MSSIRVLLGTAKENIIQVALHSLTFCFSDKWNSYEIRCMGCTVMGWDRTLFSATYRYQHWLSLCRFKADWGIDRLQKNFLPSSITHPSFPLPANLLNDWQLRRATGSSAVWLTWLNGRQNIKLLVASHALNTTWHWNVSLLFGTKSILCHNRNFTS